jgi:outer membrane receptor for ferrienterochelin and colicin
MRAWLRVASALLVLWACATPLSAQTAQVGQLAGEVKDASGAILPGASVTLTSEERGFSRTTTTDAQGRYLFPVVPLGKYSVEISLAGFEKVLLTNNLVESERTTNVPAALKLATQEVAVTVTGETPIVDATNQTVQTRLRSEEFNKIPMARSYLNLIGQAPGVVGTGNVNSHGGLTSNNQFLMDGVDTTDPTTGTFGTNLAFETIQEVVVQTSGVSAEYGRAIGAVVNVITKSGTNKFEGLFKYIATNDEWNTQNTAHNEVTGASLERTKFDQVNPVYSFAGGGPMLRDKAWFFGTYERAENTTAQQQTLLGENFQQSTVNDYWTMRLTGQLSPTQNVWFKYSDAPTTGFVIDYTVNNNGARGAAERFALTGQDQGSDQWAAQWSGVFGSSWTGEAMYADYSSLITVAPFEVSPLNDGAPHLSQADSFYYNGGQFDGFVSRPRKQAALAATHYRTIGGNSHNFKLGFDWQNTNSSNLFAYPNGQLYIDTSFDLASRTFVPNIRQDYQGGPSTSKGNTYALYARDKFDLGSRVFIEAGLRFEYQNGTSDVNADTVDTKTLSPRISTSYDVRGNGKTLVVGSYGRFYQGLLQGFSDSFASVPQQTNYDNFVWNGSSYVFSNRVELGASTFQPNLSLDPTYTDEFTAGAEQQIGQTIGVGVRYIHRDWRNLIDDVFRFRPDNTIDRAVVNLDGAERSYRGIEFTFNKRFSNNWNGAVNYTYSKTEGNNFQNNFSPLGDYEDAMCRSTTDTALGVNGIFPCSDIQANQFGNPNFDRPHLFKYSGAYSRPLGPIRATVGIVGQATSKTTYTRSRSINVLTPGTTTNAGPTLTYLYEPAGSNRVGGLLTTTDLLLEGTFRMFRTAEAGIRFESFNLFNTEEKINIGNTAWCELTTGATCSTARANFGTSTTRAHYQAPRTIRFSGVFRF